MTPALTWPRFAVCWCHDDSHDDVEQVDGFHTRDAAEAVAALDRSARIPQAHVTEVTA